MWRLAAAIAATAVLAPAWSEGLLLLDDCEGKVGAWRGTGIVGEPVHGGEGALRWEVAGAPTLDSPRFLGDWTPFDELRFWAYLDKPYDFSIPVVFPTEGGYWIVDWKLDWSGWKEQRIRLADCKPAHDPEGWERISGLGFRAQGYGQGPVPEDLVIVLDDFALHTAGDLPETSLEAWLARERRERVAKLKAQGNPYYLSVLDGLKNAKADPGLPEEITSSWQFSGLATQALCSAWAAAWDESPRKGDETLIARASALIDLCLSKQVDGSWFYSQKWQSGDPNSDRFALGPLMDAVWWLRKLPAGEAKWPEWEAPLRALVDFQYENWGKRANHAWGESATRYPNQDVFHLYEMALACRWWPETKYQQSLDETLAGLEAHLLPEGGLNYIGPETEIPCYHDLNVLWIARYYELSQDTRAKGLLERTAPYYPSAYSNEARPEYYTDCWWKHYWSDGAACGPEIVAGLTGDARNKWLADRLLERQGPGADYKAIYAGMFYRADVEAAPLPDNYVRLDRNIGGPRGRYGSWYFAGTVGGGARDTFVGAMTCRPDRPEPLDSALLAANIEVALGGEGARDRTHLYISGPDDRTSVAIGEAEAALGARYSPRRPYINSAPNPDVPPTPWQATQVWLLTREGLVGLVELEATEEQTVPYLGGEIRLGPEQRARATDDPSVFACGDLRVRLLEHNFATVAAEPARPGYAQASTRHSAVILRTGGEACAAKPGQPLRYAALIAPSDRGEVHAFTRLDAPGLWGFSVELAGRPLAAVFNPADQAATVRLPWAGPSAALHQDTGEAASVRATDGALDLRVRPVSILLITSE